MSSCHCSCACSPSSADFLKAFHFQNYKAFIVENQASDHATEDSSTALHLVKTYELLMMMMPMTRKSNLVFFFSFFFKSGEEKEENPKSERENKKDGS